jgi:hypothetical protein
LNGQIAFFSIVSDATTQAVFAMASVQAASIEFFVPGEPHGDIMIALHVETHRIPRTRCYFHETVFLASPAHPETPKQVILLSFLDLHQLRDAKCNSFVPSISDLNSCRIKRP